MIRLLLICAICTTIFHTRIYVLGIPCPELTVLDGNSTDVLGVFEDIVWVKCDVGYIIRRCNNTILDFACRLYPLLGY